MLDVFNANQFPLLEIVDENQLMAKESTFKLNGVTLSCEVGWLEAKRYIEFVSSSLSSIDAFLAVRSCDINSSQAIR